MNGHGCHTLFDVHLPGSEFRFKVAFAVDFSKPVSAENLGKELNFSQHISGYWKLPSEHSKPALVVYGEKADTIELDPNTTDVFLPPQTKSEFRRMDLALKEAAKHFKTNAATNAPLKPTQNQLIVLITTGKQKAKGSEDEQGILSSISEELCSRNIKVVIVPVGWETDFKELGWIVKRPQSLFPLKSFDDMTNETAEKIARVIKDTIGEFIMFYFIFYIDLRPKHPLFWLSNIVLLVEEHDMKTAKVAV